MFREELEYTECRSRVKKALKGIGVNNFRTFKASELYGKVQIDGLEELMLSTWSMMKCCMKYLKALPSGYEGGFVIGDFYLSIENIMKYIEADNPGEHFVCHEAEALEKVSRAAYAWLKALRMLKGQDRLPPEAFGWGIEN